MNILKVLTQRRITGNTGEDAAVKHLKKHGYRILERNYVALGHEIDVIAKNKDTLAFIEVKTRTVGSKSWETRPSASVTREKQLNIINTAKWYLGKAVYNTKLKDLRVRLDVIEVYLENKGVKTYVKELNHIEGAFRYDNELYKHTKYGK